MIRDTSAQDRVLSPPPGHTGKRRLWLIAAIVVALLVAVGRVGFVVVVLLVGGDREMFGVALVARLVAPTHPQRVEHRVLTASESP